MYLGEFVYEGTSCGTQREVETCGNKQGKIEQKQPNHGANPPPQYRQPNYSPVIHKGLIHFKHSIEQ